jgi:anti-sigma factor RsiW
MRTDQNRELIHRLLDGELAPEERDGLLSRIESDPDLAREYEALSGPVRMLAGDGRCEAPHGFSESVMQRLPQRTPSLGERVRTFLFGARVLRWNMATAMAGVLLVAAALLVTQYQDGGPTVPQPSAAEVPTTVRLSFYAPQARQVAVAGDFNRWTVGSDEMERRDGGIWTIDLTLQPGRYTYMFVLDGKSWVADPGAESYQDDGFGSRNSVMKVRI